MRIRSIFALFTVAIAGMVVGPQTWGAEASAETGSLVRSLPAGALASVEITDLAPLIERIETSPALKEYLDSPLYDDVLKTDPARKAMAGKAIFEAQLGMNLWTFAKTYFGDRMALAVYPPVDGKQPDGVLVMQVKTAADLTKLVEKVTPLVSLAGDQIVISDRDGGGRNLTLKDGNRAVLKDRWIVVGKNSTQVEDTLKNLLSGSASGLESEPAWKMMAQQLGSKHTVQICVNLVRINELMGKRLIPEKLDNPVLSLLYGGLTELAARSPYLGLTLDIHENQFSLQSAIAGKVSDLDDAHRALVLNPANPLVPLIPGISDRLGTITFSRDFVKWYKAREQLLDARLQPDFDKFETGLATFLPGKDFAEDVLPLLTGRVAFVSAPQDYAYLDGKPGVQLPAFGLVIELAKPREGSDVLNLVAQTILTVTNLEASKQKRQPWVQSSESYHDVQVNFARYLERPKGDQLATSYNFQPASALVGNRFIMSSSLGLCRQLIDALSSKESSEAVAVGSRTGIPNFVQEFSPEVAATLLEANAAVIHAKNIQNGKTAEQSTRELEAVCKLMRQLTVIRFDTVQYPDRMQLELHGGWK
ncbi:MAG: hypothetical protein JSS49_17230 [Planctomycetes bacterium]|nr:hypothetical protein [Planctomycetota bacterium]